MRLETNGHNLPTILNAATAYFALVFGAGFVLGPVRILFIVPRLGVRAAELIEAPIMLVVIVLVSKWVVNKFRLAGDGLAVGFLALGLMIASEFTLVLWLRGLTLAEYFRERDPVAATAYYLLQVVFAFMPFIVSARHSVSGLRQASKAG